VPPRQLICKARPARGAPCATGRVLPGSGPIRGAALGRSPQNGYQFEFGPPAQPVLVIGLTHVRLISPLEFLAIVNSSPSVEVAVTEYSSSPCVALLR
jgi:hypothetical protein